MPSNKNNPIVGVATVVALALSILTVGAAVKEVSAEVVTAVHDSIERNAINNGAPLR